MKKYFLFFHIFLISIFFAIFSSRTYAKEYSIEKFDVDVKINKDSTFDVTEKVTYKFNGEFSKLTRGITLVDYEDKAKCQTDPSLQCGGFDFLKILGSKFNDKNLDLDDLTIYETDDGYESTKHIDYTFGLTNFHNTSVNWEISYRIYGGIGYFDNENYDLFYWNVIPEQRDIYVESSKIQIQFPQKVNITDDDIEVYGFDGIFDYTIEDDKVVITPRRDIAPYEDFTLMLKFPHGIIKKPASMKLKLDPSSQMLKFDDLILDVENEQIISGFPEGEYNFNFSSKGYKDNNVYVNLKAGDTIDLESNLNRIMIFKVLDILLIIIFCLSCIGSFVLMFIPIIIWYKKGRDRGGKKTIVPWFKPPSDMRPYLVGALKNERVDNKDIISVLIDVASRGYLKIRQKTKDNYEFIKIKDFDDNLNDTERLILNSIFDGKDKVTSNSLQYRFYKKMPKIKKAIEKELVEHKFFDERPGKTRLKYLFRAIGLIVISVILGGLVFFSIPILSEYNLIFPISLPLLFFCPGFSLLFVFYFMPAKTPTGTLVLEQIQGFKMFLHTADRFRLAKNAPKYVKELAPKTFEEYLPYAMVLGVEKEWAKAFKDIYKSPPSWFEGDWNTFNTIYFVNSLSNLNSATSKSMSVTPSSGSSSWGSGGGWSGGGGFSGGFSGGGGGGGSIGAS